MGQFSVKNPGHFRVQINKRVVELRARHGIQAHRSAVWRRLRGLGLTRENDLRAVEQKLPCVALAGQTWIGQRQPFMRNMLMRLEFIDVDAGKGIDPGDRYPR